MLPLADTSLSSFIAIIQRPYSYVYYTPLPYIQSIKTYTPHPYIERHRKRILSNPGYFINLLMVTRSSSMTSLSPSWMRSMTQLFI